MPDSEQEDIEQRASIERLVAAGNMTHEKAGQYNADHVSKKTSGTIPDYDRPAVRLAFPTILEMDFDEDAEGCFAILRDGMTGEEVRVPLGIDPPKTTEDLIECVHAHYRGLLDTDALDETADLFDAIDRSE